jgi:glycine cleavage system H lipoate-binding protein
MRVEHCDIRERTLSTVTSGESPEKASSLSPLPCVWMWAGVVDYKLCDRHYQCEACPFDRAIRGHTGEEDPASRGIHVLSGTRPMFKRGSKLQGLRFCPLCAREELADSPTSWETFRLANAAFYHPAHMWVRIERPESARIGLDDFGQKLLGRIYLVRLPNVGTRVRAGRPCVIVVHQMGETHLFAPMTGVVQCLNEKLRVQPSLLNQDPYGEGWVLILRPERWPEPSKHLLFGERAIRWYEQEIQRLHEEIHAALGPVHAPSEKSTDLTLQDGGMPLMDSLDISEERGAMARPLPGALIEVLGPALWANLLASFLMWPRRRTPRASSRALSTRR